MCVWEGGGGKLTSHIAHANEQPRALWHIKLDPRGKDDAQYRVQHMTFVEKTLIAGEGANSRVG